MKNYTADSMIASWAAYDAAARAMVSAAARAEEDARTAAAAARAAEVKRARAAAKRNPLAKAFAAANARLDRWTAPVALLRRADDAARAIADGVIPEGIEALTAEMIAG